MGQTSFLKTRSQKNKKTKINPFSQTPKLVGVCEPSIFMATHGTLKAKYKNLTIFLVIFFTSGDGNPSKLV
jgi:hypothetical protein